MSNRYEGYPEQWIDPFSCAFIKDGIVIKMIMLDPEDGLEEMFSSTFDADSWVYADAAFKAGATTCPSIGYSYDGVNFSAPIIEEPTE
jgi:hypothetical protein